MDEEPRASTHTVCRTCLSRLQHDEAYDLFVVPGLAKKLCVCTSLSVEHLDGFPRNLCTTCYNRLNDLHDFQKQCVDSVQKFKELVTSSCFIIRTIPENEPAVVNAAVADVEIPIEQVDPTTFDPLLSSKIEIDNETDVFKMIEDVDKEPDEVENLETVDNMEEEDHMEDIDNAFNDSGSDYNHEGKNSSESDDEMPLSRLRSKTRQTKAEAKKSDKDEPKSRPKRKRISAAERNSRQVFECHICTQKFKLPKSYEDHMKCHNDQLPYQCTVSKCKRGFTTITGLRRHMEHAHTELCDLHPCTIKGCDAAFAQTRMLTMHMRKVHNIAKPIIHPCSECEKVFRCPMALKKHMYKHTGEQLPFGCTICQKRFRVSTELRDHLLRHAGIRNFVCPYCGVRRTTKQELDLHILTHTKEKKFKCDQCDHTSHNKQCMARHIKVVHMKIRDFVCKYCQKAFGSSYGCKAHERLHTRDDCFDCTICGKKFLFESRLRKHLRTHEKRKNKYAANTQTADDVQEKLAEPVSAKSAPKIPVKPTDPRRIEIVDISQLAGTSVNPIPTVSVSSWCPQSEGQNICPDCGKGFNKIAGLKLHYKVVHDKIRDFACRYCPKRFGKSSHLRHHEYTHTGEKPYECKLCHQHFRHDATLRRHMFSHNRPRREPKERKEPKEPKPKSEPRHHSGPRLRLNTEPMKNYEQYQDPNAEHEAATAQLIAQQMDECEAKRRAEAKAREIQEAAYEQLEKLKQP